MSDVLKDKKKKSTKAPSEGARGAPVKTKDSVSNASCNDELGQNDDKARAVTLENTYQLGPYKKFSVPAVTDILKDVLNTYLQEEKYEVEWSRQMTKTICEVIRARVKDLLIPRYKIVVLVHIGELTGQSLKISSRCLWDTSTDTFASYSFKNSSLFGVATVYTVYYE